MLCIFIKIQWIECVSGIEILSVVCSIWENTVNEYTQAHLLNLMLLGNLVALSVKDLKVLTLIA